MKMNELEIALNKAGATIEQFRTNFNESIHTMSVEDFVAEMKHSSVIIHAFVFSITPEGKDFWYSVHRSMKPSE